VADQRQDQGYRDQNRNQNQDPTFGLETKTHGDSEHNGNLWKTFKM